MNIGSTRGRTALICGISGQDGTYLARSLLQKGYEVWGTSRDASTNAFSNLKLFGIFNDINLVSMVVEDSRSVYRAIKQCSPTEIYYLAGQSSVGISFDEPEETIQSIVIGTLNILEIVRSSESEIRFYQAGSSECFGDTYGISANETTPFSPRSPYAVAKASAFWLVNNYREAYNIHACTGILFNHESTLRPARFVSKKIVKGVRDIAAGKKSKLQLGRLDISRDWGWSPEFVEAMWLMLQNDKPEDFVIATGKSFLLEEFVSLCFSELDLDWRDYVLQDENLYRPTDILLSSADASKAKRLLGWEATVFMPQVVSNMISNKL